MLKLCKVTEVKVLFPVLVSVFHSVQICCRHFGEGSISARSNSEKGLLRRLKHTAPNSFGGRRERGLILKWAYFPGGLYSEFLGLVPCFAAHVNFFTILMYNLCDTY